MVQESIPLRAQVKHFPNPARVYFPLPIKERYIPLRKSLKVIAEGDFLVGLCLAVKKQVILLLYHR